MDAPRAWKWSAPRHAAAHDAAQLDEQRRQGDSLTNQPAVRKDTRVRQRERQTPDPIPWNARRAIVWVKVAGAVGRYRVNRTDLLPALTGLVATVRRIPDAEPAIADEEERDNYCNDVMRDVGARWDRFIRPKLLRDRDGGRS